MKNFKEYLEDLKTYNVKQSRLKNIKDKEIIHNYSFIGKPATSKKRSLYDSFNHSVSKLDYNTLKNDIEKYDFTPEALEENIKQMEKQIENAKHNIEVLKKLKKRTEKIKTSDFLGIKEIEVELKKQYSKVESKIEEAINDKIKKILSDSTVSKFEHSFSGPVNTKGEFKISLVLNTNLPKLGITSVPKNSPKGTIEKNVNEKINERIAKDSSFGTISRMVVDQLNKDLEIPYNVRFVDVNSKNNHSIKISGAGWRKSSLTPRDLQDIEVQYYVNLIFSLGSKK